MDTSTILIGNQLPITNLKLTPKPTERVKKYGNGSITS